MQDLSIEYAHIYTNNKINQDQKISLDILGKVKREAERKHQTFSLVVLVDDYSFPNPAFDYDKFNSWLTEKGFKPDIVFRESQLIPLCNVVLEHLNNIKLQKELVDYIKTKKYPCSLFIAAWYLLRLGYLKDPIFDEDLSAKQLISILPKSFKHFEDEGLKIMESSSFSGSEKLVKHYYFDGRLLI
jgi:hypothetical protein